MTLNDGKAMVDIHDARARLPVDSRPMAAAYAGLHQAIIGDGVMGAFWVNGEPMENTDELKIVDEEIRAAFRAEPLFRDPMWLMTQDGFAGLVRAALALIAARCGWGSLNVNQRAVAEGADRFDQVMRDGGADPNYVAPTAPPTADEMAEALNKERLDRAIDKAKAQAEDAERWREIEERMHSKAEADLRPVLAGLSTPHRATP